MTAMGWGRCIGAVMVSLFVACSGRTEIGDDPALPPIFVRQTLKLYSPQCAVQADPLSLTLLGGMMDVALTRRYSVVLLVGNLLGAEAASGAALDANRVVLDAATVTVLLSDGTAAATVTVPTTGFADPKNENEPGWGVVFVRAIDEDVGAALAARTLPDTVLLRIRVAGTTLGGVPVATPEFTFPVELCNGCLINYPAGADDPVQPGYQCVPYYDYGYDHPCIIGQDDLVDCRHCLNISPLCTAP